MFKTVNSKAYQEFIANIESIDPKNIEDKDIFVLFQDKTFKKYKEADKTIYDFYKYIGRKLTAKRKAIIENEQYHHEMRLKYRNGINRPKVQELLNIDEKTYKKLKEKKIIEPYKYDYFRKYGKEFEVPLYRYDDIIGINKKVVEDIFIDFNGSRKEIEQIKKIADILKKENVFIYNKKWYAVIPLPAYPKIKMRVLLSSQPFFNKKFKEDPIESLLSSKEKDKNNSIIKEATDTIEQSIPNLDLEYNKILLKNLEFCFLNVEDKKRTLSTLKKSIEEAKNMIPYHKNILSKKEQRELKEQINEYYSLDNYVDSFPEARSRERHFHIIEGPTNSGKTYEAIEALKNSKSGAYLGPLRLLALEVKDILSDSNIPCDLVTGEECIKENNSKHISSTIETLDTDKYYQTVVIDEMQMFENYDRGSAWTKAIVGCNADNIYIIGQPEATKALVTLIEYIGDTYTITSKERRSSLEIINKHIKYSSLKKGDALIAYSKVDVLRYSTKLKDYGYKVSMIYGSMPPEVRRNESDNFRNGETDILVATDAIGMGLNLPISRIIFGAGKKYDGFEYRELRSEEIKQVAGRAGRNNETGYVGIIKEPHTRTFNYSKINHSLTKEIDDLNPIFKVSIDYPVIEYISESMETNSLELIHNFHSLINSNKLFMTVINKDIMDKAKILDKNFKDIKLKHKLSLIPTNHFLMDDFEKLVNGKKHSISKYKPIFEKNIYNNFDYFEQYYRFLILFKTLNSIDKNTWIDDFGLEEEIESVLEEIDDNIQYQSSERFSKNLSKE